MNDFMQAAYKRAADEAIQQQKTAEALVQKRAGIASWMELSTTLLTVAALLLLGKAAAQIAWVFFQK